MKRKTYIIKEITCPQCQGYGFFDNEYGMQPVLSDELEELKCDLCHGEGYIKDEVDTINGFRVITLEGDM